MKTQLSILLFFLFFIGKTNAQNPVSGFYFSNPYYYNPAMAGIEGKKKLSLNWIKNFEGHNGYFGFEHPFEEFNSNIGIQVNSHQDYFQNYLTFKAAYNYNFHLFESLTYSIGFQFTHFNAKRKPEAAMYNIEEFRSVPNMDIGIVAKYKKVTFGISILSIWGNRAYIYDPLPVTPSSSPIIYYTRTNREKYYSISYDINMSSNFDLTIAGITRVTSKINYSSTDLSTYFTYRKKFSAGITFRAENFNGSFLAFSGGVKIKQKLNMQFIINPNLNTRGGNNFEVLVQYTL